MLITVFTPAYNRAHLLPRLYESLQRQTFHDFEWVIVDDGSVDETASLFSSNENDNENENGNENGNVKIRYFYQENGGKHRAINRGVKEARGELFFIVDSDDALLPNSLEIIWAEYLRIRHEHDFCGVSGMKGYFNNVKVGTQASFGHLDCTIIESNYKYHLHGDKAEVFKTDILKDYPFPEFDGERFCPEALIWNRISNKYKIRYFDKIIYYCEYLPDGLTNRISSLLEKNLKSTMLTYKEMVEYDGAPFIYKLKSALNFYRYSLFTSFVYSHDFRLKKKWIWTLPLGVVVRLIKG